MFSKYYIPKGDGWFRLEKPVGRETFYLLASRQRLNFLEGLVKEYYTAKEKERTTIAEKILAEIRNIKRKHRSLKTVAERPIRTIGRLRSTTDNSLASIAVELSADNFLSRTFTIDHK